LFFLNYACGAMGQRAQISEYQINGSDAADGAGVARFCPLKRDDHAANGLAVADQAG